MMRTSHYFGCVFLLSGAMLTGCDNSTQSALDAAASSRKLPKATGAKSLSRHYVEVTFAEAPGVAGERTEIYRILGPDNQLLPVQATFTTEDPRQVILTTAAQEEAQYSLWIGTGDADLGPQPPDLLSETNGDVITFGGNVGFTEPWLVSAISLSNTTVLLTFNLRMDRPTTQNRNFYDISDPNLNILGAVLAADDFSLTLTTSPQEAIEYAVKVTNIRGNINLYGGPLIDPDHSQVQFYGIAPNDAVRPKLVRADMLDYETVVLSFSEPLGNHADNVANYAVAPSLTVLGVTLNEWSTQATLKVLPVTAGLVYTVTANSFIEDRAGNLMDPAFKTATFGIPANETTKPTVVSAVAVDCETVLVTFSEPVSDNAGDPSNYAVAPGLVIVNAQLSEFKTQALLTTLPMTPGTEYTVTVANITDSVGNVIDVDNDTGMFKCEVGANPEALGPLPRMVAAASLSNTSVLVSYDRPMNDSAIDPTHYFIVQINVNGEVGTLVISDAEFPDMSDKSLVLLSTSSQNEVTYQVSAVGVRDEQGNPLAPRIGFNGLILHDPGSAVFPGTPPGATELADNDEDGIPDGEELRGRMVVVELLGGERQERQVTSNPFLEDTDADGLNDYTERTLNTNPRDPDTDGDLLSDEREFNFFYSNPNSQDSDGDGTDDGLEVSFFKTAPHLADTDGDGFDDGKELYELSRNPNLADLPRPNIRADNIFLQINEKYTYQDTDGRTISDTSSSQATLTQSNETKFSSSDTDVLKVGAEVGFKTNFKGAEVSIGANFGAEFTSQTTEESSQSAQRQYQTSVERAREISLTRQVTREILGASVTGAITIVNEGDIAFTIGNLEVSVLQQTGPNRSKFLPIATLVPSGGNDTFNLGPLIPERGPFIFKNSDVFPNLVEDLMRAPRGLVLKVANFDMTDEFGRNFAFISQEVNDRTAEIRMDFGDGRTAKYRVATYGGLDDAGFAGPMGEFVGGFDAVGQTAGIPLDYALQAILGLVKNPTEFDAIVAGPDGFANTVAADDDVQDVPPATPGLDERQIVVSAGANGVLDTMTPLGDDVKAKTIGYDTSFTCNESTTERIIEPPGGDGIVSTRVRIMRCINGRPGTDGLGSCSVDADCDDDPPCMALESDCLGKCQVVSDDVQQVAFGTMNVAENTLLVSAGPNGVLETVPDGDDLRRGPGDPCTSDGECLGGACDGRQVITRFENSQNGDRNRFWVAMTSDAIPVGTDVGDVNLQPGFVILFAFIQDVDRDGLSAQEEYMHGSNDRSKDTDGDGLGDFAEIRIGWTVETAEPYHAFPDPRLADSDGDGKFDADEMMATTDPRLADTDIDGIDDNFECDNQSGDPSPGKSMAELCDDPPYAISLDPLKRDSDGDQLVDGREVELGTCPLDPTSGPEFLDTDEDGLTNAQETTPDNIMFVACNGMNQTDFNVTSSPGNGDTDFDGLPDLLEVGSMALGIPGLGSNPRDVDSDNDGLLDFDEFANFALYQHLSSEFPGFFLAEGDSQRVGTSLVDCDTDGDGLTDSFEHEGGWTVLAVGDATARQVTSSPLSADTDADGLDDGDELAERTDPTDPDTDGDGRRDGDEVSSGSNPLAPDISVRVVYRRISFPDGPECSGSAAPGAEWEWSLRVRRPSDGTGEGQLVDLRTCQEGIPCRTIFDLDEFSSSFVLRPGDTFSLAGMILDRDFCCNYSYIPEDIAYWGEANQQFFCPGDPDPPGCCTGASVSCVGNFIKTISFEDLVGGPDHVVGTLMLGAETFINIEGGDENGRCKANIHYEVIVE